TLHRDLQRIGSRGTIHTGTILLTNETRHIKKVHVGRPPIMMNRDTLEINPEAFEVEPNAVIEDVLAKVPGIVIWGDGEITVNGKKVQKVLVDGKRFFGNNSVVATRNLPSDVIDRVKVYDSPTNAPNDEETLQIDIILKKGKKRGVFGKISLNEGTDGRKERIFLANYYDRKNQVSLFGGTNNTNKIAHTINDFQAANVYKAGGENLSFNTPLSGQTGLNNYGLIGAKIERIWNNQLSTNAEILHRQKQSEYLINMEEIRLLGDGDTQRVVELQIREGDEARQRYFGTAKFNTENWDLQVNAGIQNGKISSDRVFNREVYDERGEGLLMLHRTLKAQEQSRGNRIGFELKRKRPSSSTVEISYNMEVESRKAEHWENIRSDESRPLDRQKGNDDQATRHEVKTIFGLDRLFVEATGRPMNLTVNLVNNLTVHRRVGSQIDKHFDPLTGSYSIFNKSFSYSDKLKETVWKPEINATKSIIKKIGRGQNSLHLTTALGFDATSRENRSDNEVRILDKYNLFTLPSVGVQYVRSRQLSRKSLSLAYNTLVRQPEIYQLISLVDTTQKDFNYFGNASLVPEERYQFSFELRDIFFAKNSSQYLRFSYSLIRNQLTDSSSYLSNGTRLRHTVNTEGLSSFQTDYQYQMGRKLWEKPLDLKANVKLNGGQQYFYNNDVRHKNSWLDSWLQLQAHYSILDDLKIGFLGESIHYWALSYIGKNSAGLYTAGVDAVLTWPRRTTLISRLESKHFYTKGISTNQLYIWNIDFYYRVLKKAQLEIKLSVYDLLKNNETIQYMVRDNMTRQTNVNNIQQFFMIGLSYYPRIF
ncbi:MAG: hypothetical protein ACTJHT_16180, partial [Sphingobacterium sp.]